MARELGNELEDDEIERLAMLLEELGEVSQAAGKILRFGYREDLTKHLAEEISNLNSVVELMRREFDLCGYNYQWTEKHINKKKRNSYHQVPPIEEDE